MAGVDQALDDEEYARVALMLKRSERAMNLETLDGFFVALICGPEMVPPSEYLREIWGGDRIGGSEGWRDEAEMQEFFDLVLRHWNSIARTLNSGQPFLPFLFEDDAGVVRANDWATGFTRGMRLDREGWAAILDDDEHGGLLVPIFALAHEHDPDPSMRPYKDPMSGARRRQLVTAIGENVPAVYRYFLARRRLPSEAKRRTETHRRPGAKVGRNDPCPCGSGKKFKKCCGAVTVH